MVSDELIALGVLSVRVNLVTSPKGYQYSCYDSAVYHIRLELSLIWY